MAIKLEAWGYRPGLLKGEYSATVKRAGQRACGRGGHPKGTWCWPPWTPRASLRWTRGRPGNKPMQDYCVTDVEVTHKSSPSWRATHRHLPQAAGRDWGELRLAGHRVQEMMNDQERRGFGHDVKAGIALAAQLKPGSGSWRRSWSQHSGPGGGPEPKRPERGYWRR